MIVVALLTNTLNGQQYSVNEDWPVEAIDMLDYLWNEGNYSCDCNRSKLARIEELPCNTGENVIRLDGLLVLPLAKTDEAADLRFISPYLEGEQKFDNEPQQVELHRHF